MGGCGQAIPDVVIPEDSPFESLIHALYRSLGFKSNSTFVRMSPEESQQGKDNTITLRIRGTKH